MKALSVYLGLTLLITLVPASLTYAQILESEPNNEFGTSNEIENVTSFSGQLYSAEDTDFYSFDIRSPSTLELRIVLPTNNNVFKYFKVRILDIDEVVYGGYQSGRLEGEISTFLPEPGNYFIVIEDGDFYDSGMYVIDFKVTPVKTPKTINAEEISENLEEKVVELEQKIDVLLKTISALNSLEDENTRARNIETLLDQIKSGSSDEIQKIKQLQVENAELRNHLAYISRQVLDLGHQLEKFTAPSNTRDATDSANLQRDRAEERIAELKNALEQLAGQNEGALKSLEQQLAEALAAKVKAEGERQNLTEDLQAALAARLAADELADERLSALEQREILLAEARKSLGVSEDLSEKRANELIEAAKQQELLNQQVATLRAELGKLQELLALSEQKDADSQIQLQNLGNRLNAALARAASEERKRRKLEEAERIRLEAEAKKLEEERNQLADQAQDLANYKSEFFGRLREILAGQEGVKIVGDRFVFSSEVLFEPGAASLSEAGQLEIDKVANILLGVKDSIPDTIEWVIRVDGHTDNIPLSGAGEFRDNWELSQARALSVVRYMVEALQFPANRMAANGFGEFQPVNTDDTPEARAQNRRIEIKLTER